MSFFKFFQCLPIFKDRNYRYQSVPEFFSAIGYSSNLNQFFTVTEKTSDVSLLINNLPQVTESDNNKSAEISYSMLIDSISSLLRR